MHLPGMRPSTHPMTNTCFKMAQTSATPQRQGSFSDEEHGGEGKNSPAQPLRPLLSIKKHLEGLVLCAVQALNSPDRQLLVPSRATDVLECPQGACTIVQFVLIPHTLMAGSDTGRRARRRT